jgi:hypothetical protein
MKPAICGERIKMIEWIKLENQHQLPMQESFLVWHKDCKGLDIMHYEWETREGEKVFRIESEYNLDMFFYENVLGVYSHFSFINNPNNDDVPFRNHPELM